MKRSKALSLAVVLLGLPSSASANAAELDLATKNCLDAISNADNRFEGRDAAMPYADKIVAIATEELAVGNIDGVLKRLNEDGATCVSYVRQINDVLKFYPELGDFYTTTAAQAQLELARKAVLEERKKEMELQAAARIAEQDAKQKALEIEVNARVFSACAQLANRDPLKAFTNELCVRSFKANGLPE
ncbi:hypothetical protein [Maritimibacter sp. HL-12]|uniref:hypothetical protein n=1 Tax=Maritimibacter sp. HL-12 TaxID=1162418 RepID=UPI000A0F381C|nr:hypothetical protein [Maritimibacter sp. HL-12]SMH55677.1 hypothetical protein SAMN05661107_3128 [Maritimibacter sp. HL-12]